MNYPMLEKYYNTSLDCFEFVWSVVSKTFQMDVCCSLANYANITATKKSCGYNEMVTISSSLFCGSPQNIQS